MDANYPGRPLLADYNFAQLAFSVRQSSIPFAAKSDRTKTMRCNPATLIVAAGAGLIAIAASIPTTLAGPGSDTQERRSTSTEG